MICPDCVKGMMLRLATKELAYSDRETLILTNPQRYLNRVPCSRCNGSGIANCCDGEYDSQLETFVGVSTGKTKSMVA